MACQRYPLLTLAVLASTGPLIAEASRPVFELNVESDAEVASAIEKSYDNATATALLALQKEHEWGCHEYCFTCPASDGGEVEWRIERAQGGMTRFAKGALAVGGLVALGASGIVALPVAGIVASIGVSAGAAIGVGAIGGGLLVKDMLANERYCPNVYFHERNPQNSGWRFKKNESVAEETYRLDEINFLELMGSVEDKSTGASILGRDYKRNELPKQDRLHSLLACNFLQQKTDKWADMAIQLEYISTAVRKWGSVKTAIVAECAKWLCAADPTEVKELGSYTASFKKCGGRSSWHPKSIVKR